MGVTSRLAIDLSCRLRIPDLFSKCPDAIFRGMLQWQKSEKLRAIGVVPLRQKTNVRSIDSESLLALLVQFLFKQHG